MTRSSAAADVVGGLSVGGIAVGTSQRFSLSPHLDIAWRRETGLLLGAHDVCSILPAVNRLGTGVYNQTSVAIGYASTNIQLSLGPSISVYSMPACGQTLCGRVVGLSPGGHAEASVYWTQTLGVSVRANLDWVGGESLVLPSGVAAMLIAGPVFRWSSRK